MTLFDELVEESQPTLTSMPDRKRLDEPWHWTIRLNYADDNGPIDLTKAKAECTVTSNDDVICSFTTACGKGSVTIDAGKAQIDAVAAATDKGECFWHLDLKLPKADGRTVRIFGPDSFGIVPELITFH